MKKILLSVAALSMLFGATVFTSCKKDTNTTAPTITLNGANPYTVILGATYTDPGAKATDNAGNDITSSITTTVTATNPNMAIAASYTITYNVTDANGNVATPVTRTVYVTIVANTLLGHWGIVDVTDTTVDYNDVLTDGTVNPTTTLYTAQFGDYPSAAVYFVLSGNSGTVITVPQQQVTCGTDLIARTFTGSGTVNTDGSGFKINYTVVDSAGTVTGTDTYSGKTRVRK
jgi:hypothetical protein